MVNLNKRSMRHEELLNAVEWHLVDILVALQSLFWNEWSKYGCRDSYKNRFSSSSYSWTCQNNIVERVKTILLNVSKQYCWTCQNNIVERVKTILLNVSKQYCWTCQKNHYHTIPEPPSIECSNTTEPYNVVGLLKTDSRNHVLYTAR